MREYQVLFLVFGGLWTFPSVSVAKSSYFQEAYFSYLYFLYFTFTCSCLRNCKQRVSCLSKGRAPPLKNRGSLHRKRGHIAPGHTRAARPPAPSAGAPSCPPDVAVARAPGPVPTFGPPDSEGGGSPRGMSWGRQEWLGRSQVRGDVIDSLTWPGLIPRRATTNYQLSGNEDPLGRLSSWLIR